MTRWPPDDASADEDEDLEGEWELDPNDPSHPDYDLSESAGYANWEPAPATFLARRTVVLLIVVLLVLALVAIPLYRLI